MKKVKQAGAILLNRIDFVLIVTNINGAKTFPKGSVEPGESLKVTLLREITEETGLTDINIVNELGIITRNGYTEANLETPSVIKTIHVFLCRTDSEKEPVPQTNGVIKAEWLSIKDVESALTYKEDSEFFIKQSAKLKK